jgi:hypothetical protein
VHANYQGKERSAKEKGRTEKEEVVCTEDYWNIAHGRGSASRQEIATETCVKLSKQKGYNYTSGVQKLSYEENSASHAESIF